MPDQEVQIVEEGPIRPFNPHEHLIQIRSGQTYNDYLPVQWRLVWFRSAFPHGTIETEMLRLDLDRETQEESFAWNAERRRNEKVVKQAKGFCMFHAIVRDGMGGMATGTKSEKAASFPDFIEKAETGAIGRALAALGYGTQFTDDEFNEKHRIVDAPVERTPTDTTVSETTPAPAPAPARIPAPAPRQATNGTTSPQRPAATPPSPKPAAPEQDKKAPIVSTPTPTPVPETKLEAKLEPIIYKDDEITNTIPEIIEELTSVKALIGKHEFAAMHAWRQGQMNIPESSTTWTLLEYRKALKGWYRWMDEQNPTWGAQPQLPEQLEDIKKIIATHGSPVIMNLCDRLFDTTNMTKLTRHQSDVLIQIGLDQKFFIALLADKDPHFGDFQGIYPDLAHPLDLITTLPGDTKFQDYRTSVCTRIKEKTWVVSDAFKNNPRNKKHLDAFVQ